MSTTPPATDSLVNGNGRRRITWALAAALLISVLLIGTAAWSIAQLYQAYDVAAPRRMAMNDRLARLLYLDESLTMSVNMAAATGDARWRARYAALSVEYGLLLTALREHLTTPDLKANHERAVQAGNELLSIESAVMREIGAGRRADGVALLQLPVYAEQKKRYAQGVQSMSAALRAEGAVQAESIARRNGILVALTAALSIAAVVCWLFSIRLVRRFLARQRAVEADLRRSEERFLLAARATEDAIWDWDITAETVWFNESFKTAFGYPSWGVMPIGVWYEGIHPDDAPRLAAVMEQLFAGTGSNWYEEYRFRDGAGTYREMIDRGSLLRDEAGKPVRMIGAMMDASTRRAAGRNLADVSALKEQILASVGEGIFGLDLEGRTTFVNAAASTMLGWSAEELIGKNIHEIAHHTAADGIALPWHQCPAFETLKTGLRCGGDGETFWTRDGRSIPVEYLSDAMISPDGVITGAVVTVRDISEQREVERIKNEFVAVVSHELRTPLTSIRGALSLLASGRLGKLQPKGDHLLRIAASNTERLVRLINDILDIERVDSPRAGLSRSHCDAMELVQQAVEPVRILADREAISIHIDAPEVLPLYADPDRIIQTLTNLAGNAVKFSPSGSVIDLTVTPRETDVLFTISDHGRGIPADDLEKVFERFHQVDASDSREKGGSGLGLAICRSIVRQHGGKIWAESKLGAGSTFSFTIPHNAHDARGSEVEATDGPRSAPRAIQLATEEEGGAGRTIYVCDDDEDTRALVATLLRTYGYTVGEMAGGEELIAASIQRRPDAILLDLFMPDMSGWEALARLRDDPATQDVPVVVVSVLTREESGRPFTALSGWLEKPIYEHELLSVVKRIFATATHTPRVVVVEDDAQLASVIGASFERLGVHTIHVASGREAIELARTMRPDLLVLDLVLPGLDGFAVIDWLKDHGIWQGVPLVVYSALETSPSQRARLRLGPTEFIAKSKVVPEEFERRVLSLLNAVTASAKGNVSDVA